MACEGSKSPGPDSFDFSFIKKFWEILKHDFFSCVKHFESSGRIANGCNSSSIVLIPKKSDPLELRDYRPISLIGCIYKVIAKILSICLEKIISKIVSPNQSAFIKGRQILDGALVTNEIISLAKKEKTELLLLNVDFEKAFDCVNWEFLLDIMKQMGFGNKWCRWIKTCISSASVSILLNGSPTKEFKLSRGLRQGDPLSPLNYDD